MPMSYFQKGDDEVKANVMKGYCRLPRVSFPASMTGSSEVVLNG